MESTVSYRCPNCDAGLVFNAEKQKFTCEFCMSEFTKEELDTTETAKRAERIAKENEEFREQIHEYRCPGCGAEVIADLNTAAQYCYYCHNPVVLTDKLSGVWKPTKVIPFKFDKEGAKARFLEYVKKKHFLPRDYFSDRQLNLLTGIYFPFWVTDADTDSSYQGVGHRIRTWRQGEYRYTETSDFAVTRRGEIHFEDLVTAALSTADKKMLEGILPYPTDSYVDFSMPYLQGFVAKKRDIERESINGEIRRRMNEYSRTLLSRTVGTYHSVTGVNTQMNVLSSHFEYALMPLWILTYHTKKNDKKYTYAMNGYTGKIYGELPVSVPKLLLLFGAIAGAIILLAMLLGGLLL